MDQTLSYTAALVLQSIAKGHQYGFEIMRVTDLASGTVYPLLRRLERARLVTSRWEDLDPVEEGRPRRRTYEITRSGQQALAAAVERLANQRHLFESGVSGKAAKA